MDGVVAERCGGSYHRILHFVSGFTKRQAADDFARELGSALKLPFKDFADTKPDDPDLFAENNAQDADKSQRGRQPGRMARPRSPS